MTFTPGRIVPLWRHRDLVICLAALTVSALGSALTDTALLLHQQDTATARWAVAPLLAASALPLVVLAPVAGWLADRYDSRVVLVIASLWQAACCAGLATVPAQPIVLALVALLFSGVAVVGATVGALVPRLVEPERFNAANSLRQGSAYVAMLFGPAIAGLLYGLSGLSLPLALDAASFVVVAAGALAIATRRDPQLHIGEAPNRLSAGLVSIRADRVLAALLVLLVSVVAVGEVSNVVEVFLVRQTLSGSVTAFGLLTATWAAGMVGGSVVAGRIGDAGGWVRAIVGGCLVLAVTMLGYSAVPSVGWLFGLSAIGGLANGLLNGCVGTLTVVRTPDSLRGRVGAAMAGATRAASIGALLIGGGLAAALAPRAVYVCVGVATLVVTAACAPALRRAGRSAPVPAARPAPSDAG